MLKNFVQLNLWYLAVLYGTTLVRPVVYGNIARYIGKEKLNLGLELSLIGHLVYRYIGRKYSDISIYINIILYW